MERKPESGQVTRLLREIGSGDQQAAAELIPLVYGELRRLAGARMAGEKPGQTLQPTALVHEAYMRLVGDTDPGWDNRGHFFAAAAEAMRRILVDRARRKSREKHGGGLRRTTLDRQISTNEGMEPEELLALHRALRRLEAKDEDMSRVVELRFFAGLTVEEIAAVLGVSERTVYRAWDRAKAWLKRDMTREGT